jgi:ABC-type dipeptide/oligopeptide/nickel transport system permease subunit
MKIVYISVFIFIIGIALFGSFIMPYDPIEMDLSNSLNPPSNKHIFGTDNQGRDILSRIIYGCKISIGIGIFAAFVSVVIGVLVGLSAGFLGGIVDKILCSCIDIALSFPSLLLAIGISIVLPPGLWSVVLALSLSGWAGFARFTRGIVWSLKNMNYIEAASVLGVSTSGVLFKHILPNCFPLIAVTGFMNLGTFILSEASLSFLGLGIPPPYPTWGGMINYGREFIQIAPWIVIFPGLFLAITVISCNMLGDILCDRLDPKTKNLKKKNTDLLV